MIHANVTAELAQLSHELLDMIRSRDGARLRAVLHPEFVQVGEGGVRTSREAFVGAVESSDYEITGLSFEFLSVDAFDGTGVVCGVQRAAVRLASGEEVTGRTAFTDVFVNAGAGWQLRIATSAELAP